MTHILQRRFDAPRPYQNWDAFPSHAIVQVWNVHGESKIAQAKDLWWGYDEEMGGAGEGVITKARRLDREKVM
jgi:hypothetical protein